MKLNNIMKIIMLVTLSAVFSALMTGCGIKRAVPESGRVLLQQELSNHGQDNYTRQTKNSQEKKGSGLYRVVRVVDGDTIVIEIKDKQEKLRLIGINTPETNHLTRGVEPYGREAAFYTKKLLDNREVRVEFDVQQRDEYGRLLGYIYLADGTFVNARLVEAGYAQVMTIPPNVKYAGYFSGLQRQARKAGKGLWEK